MSSHGSGARGALYWRPGPQPWAGASSSTWRKVASTRPRCEPSQKTFPQPAQQKKWRRPGLRSSPRGTAASCSSAPLGSVTGARLRRSVSSSQGHGGSGSKAQPPGASAGPGPAEVAETQRWGARNGGRPSLTRPGPLLLGGPRPHLAPLSGWSRHLPIKSSPESAPNPAPHPGRGKERRGEERGQRAGRALCAKGPLPRELAPWKVRGAPRPLGSSFRAGDGGD